jgi:hypothetical protein
MTRELRRPLVSVQSVLAALLLIAPALAQEAPASPDAAASVQAVAVIPPAEPVPDTPPPLAEAPAFVAATAAPTVELLPASAYPEHEVRGIKGGSLWSIFHGLQWPYRPHAHAAGTTLGLSGSLWIDTGYEQIERGDPNQQDLVYWLQQGRGVLRATPTYTRSDDWFVQGQAELVANKDQTINRPEVADVDDLWVRAGKWDTFDVQVGRFEAWEVYHLGMGLDLNTLERRGAVDGVLAVPELYGVTYTFYRPSGAGNVAAHLYPAKYLRFELLGQVGNDAGLNSLAGRPAAIFDVGWLKLKAAGEYRRQRAQAEGAREERDTRGAGASVELVFDPHVELGASVAHGLVDHIDVNGNLNRPGSVTVQSVGGFANARIVGDLIAGAGLHYTTLENIHRDDTGRVGEFSHLQAFFALQYILLDQLYVKAVVAHANAELHPSFTANPAYENAMLSGRLRLTYAF